MESNFKDAVFEVHRDGSIYLGDILVVKDMSIYENMIKLLENEK